MAAVEVGVAGVAVSNHGGRQLDYTPSTISVLEDEKFLFFSMEEYAEGQTFKAFALGAQAVLVGGPVIYGLSANGERGVRRQVIEMLKDEFELIMALSGCLVSRILPGAM